MAASGKKISELIKDKKVTGEELIPIMDSDGKTKSISVKDIVTLISSTLISDVDKKQNQKLQELANELTKHANIAEAAYNKAVNNVIAINELDSKISEEIEINKTQQESIDKNAQDITYNTAADNERFNDYIEKVDNHIDSHIEIDNKQQEEIDELKETVSNIEMGGYTDPWEEYQQ